MITLRDYSTIQSIKPKQVELEFLLCQEKIHIAVVTWLKIESVFTINSHNAFRKNMLDSYGGVAIIVHKSIRAQAYPIVLNNSDIEIVCVRVLNCASLCNIVSLHCPSTVQTV